jgi:sugar phosphate isomerase/epimerase
MRILLLIVFSALGHACLAQQLSNEFFVFQNIFSGDNVHNNYDSQVKFVKSLGFDGIEIGSEESFEGMIAAIEENKFKCSSFYVKIKLEDQGISPLLQSAIQRLKGTGAVISPHIIRETKRSEGPNETDDAAAVRLLRELSDLCKQSGLQVALYPHLNFYLETTDHALALAKKLNRKNVGLGFNLCHWLATTNEVQRKDLYPHLRALSPCMKMMSICGANDVFSSRQNIWDDYILPLGQGSFQTGALVEYVTRELGY